MKRMVAFLRGINVGGNTLVNMAQLQRALANLGLTRVQTLLASGNVIFETAESGAAALAKKIEQRLQNDFGIQVPVILRTSREIQSLVDAEPFKKIKVTPQTRLHVTFLAEKPGHGLKISQRLSNNDFEIIRFSEREICSVVESDPGRGTGDLMKVLEKEFGKKITTRTWNTVQRIAALLAAE
jgi:uncharacterized protein (DUF1697 family)